MRRILGVATLAVVALSVVLIGSASGAGPTYSNGFETDTAGWFDSSDPAFNPDFGTITRQPDGYLNAPYADGIDSASGGFHARLDRTTCYDDPNGGGSTVNCPGPLTRWGGYASTWYGGWTTQVDVYLDAAYAQANADTSTGNLNLITDPTNPDEKGMRFDYSSAVNNAAGTFMRDFGFSVATGPDPHVVDPVLCPDGWIATAGNNINRSGADTYNPGFDPQCIADSGWYTFKHTFYADGNNLKALMEIIDVDTSAVVADWTVTSGDLIVTPNDPSKSVGCNRYGWFTNQEIFGLPIDNASIDGGCTAPEAPATLNVTKFYDADADGTKDPTESDITGWKVQVANGSTQVGTTPFPASGLAPGNYTASESSPNEANWIATTPTSVDVTLAAGDEKSVSFGNVCRGDGGGLTIGFWGNKNGQALVGPDDLSMLRNLNLRNADGSTFDPTTYAQLKTWLSKASATNMAYMLSAQLAAMELNVLNGKVAGTALVYAPGVTGANGAGFITVDALIAEANAALAADGLTKSGDPNRNYQQTLMNALNQANQDNSTSYVQAGPCAFTFPGPVCDAGTGNTDAGYNSMPTDIGLECPLQNSYSFEGRLPTKEFGDKVQLNTTSGTAIDTMTVAFSSFGCGDSGHWYDTDGACTTGSTTTFTIPDGNNPGSGGLHARIYSVKPDGTPDQLIGEAVNNGAIPFRPSADNTNCVNPGTDSNGGDDRGKWYNAAADLCQNGYQFNVAFDFSDIPVSPNQTVIWTVTYNTSNSGFSPLGNGTACRIAGNPGCGYDSLNVGTWTFANAEYAGLDVVDAEAWADDGLGGGLIAHTDADAGADYTIYKPLAEITLN
jgi:hypothetical protein